MSVVCVWGNYGMFKGRTRQVIMIFIFYILCAVLVYDRKLTQVGSSSRNILNQAAVRFGNTRLVLTRVTQLHEAAGVSE